MVMRERATTLTSGAKNSKEPAADPLGPEKGQFRLQVDRQNKASYVTYEAAEAAGRAIKQGHPILLVAVYDAVTGENKVIELPKV